VTRAVPVSLATAHASIPRQKLSWHIMGTEGSTGQRVQPLGTEPHPRAPAPALCESARTAGSQIIPAENPGGCFRYVSVCAARLSLGTLLVRLHAAVSRCAAGSETSCSMVFFFPLRVDARFRAAGGC